MPAQHRGVPDHAGGSGRADHPLEVKFQITPTRARHAVDPVAYWDYVLQLPGEPSQEVSVAYNAQEQLYEGTVVIPEDELFVDLELVPHDDTYLELAEDVTLRVVEQPGSPWNAGVWYVVPPEGSEATVTIEDNDEAQVYALTYGGAANYVTTDPMYNAGTPFEDWPTDTLIDVDHWFDKDVGADAVPPAPPSALRYDEDRAFPVSYVRSLNFLDERYVDVDVEFLRTPEPGYRVFVRADGPPWVRFPWTAASDQGGISLAQLTSSGLPNTVTYYQSFALSWEYSVVPDDESQPGEPRSAGTSANELYVTWAEPTTSPLYHSLLHIGTVPASGESVQEDVVAKVWEPFDGLAVFRRDGQQLVYYGQSFDWHDPQSWQFTTAGLLEHAAGRCGAWMNLFADVLAAQGIASLRAGLVPPPRPGWIGRIQVIPPHGQGGVVAPTLFDAHAVVIYEGRLFDPSYGTEWNSLSAWEDSNLRYIYYRTPGNPFDEEYVNNRPGVEDLLMQFLPP